MTDMDEVISADDIYLFNEGRHFRLYEHLGAHCSDGGVTFAVWAPNASSVSAVGDRNGWTPHADELQPCQSSGIWVGELAGWGVGDRYKFHIEARSGYRVDKADPFAFQSEEPPATASVVADLGYEWHDDDWMAARGEHHRLDGPISIYEVHLGSWRRNANGDFLSYREMAPLLAQHAKEHGFTHVELLPIMEHPFYGSWGYQTTGYFAPTRRYGTATDFKEFVDHMHHEGIGVILDWVPSHFPSDEHALGYFDGTHLFEHADPRQGFHPDWNSLIFNYGRPEVRSFLISSACFWLDAYHGDGIRVDAVASMLYLDYSRKAGEWIPNKYGGRENLEAISFLRELNEAVYGGFPDVHTYAEESTAWPMVSRPTYLGGLGFGMKWDMGWMHDTLLYMSRDPVHRRFHHDELTFRAIYAGSENYVLPLSHDEVVHGKGSLVTKMPGDAWQKLANLRLLLAYQWALPAKKLLFMGGEIGQWREWDHESSLEWHLLDDDAHAGVARLVGDLNRLLIAQPALHERDTDPHGFGWAVADDADHSTLAFLRYANDGSPLLWVGNFTPMPQYNFRTPVPQGGHWVEACNTDAASYGGSGVGNLGEVEALPVPVGEHYWSLTLTLPPLGAILLHPRASIGDK
ncbi:MAG: 1,4-alpha-glucan branching enzyme [Actinomycetia bacterium]|nr:1,4-alpha-glucan branching enzyme [Actinomycetes bacterium]